MIYFHSESLVDKMSEEEKKSLYSNCSLIFNNPSFKLICDELASSAIVDLAKNFVDRSEKESAFFSGAIDGVARVFEEVSKYNAIYMDSIKKKEEFDKHDII